MVLMTYQGSTPIPSLLPVLPGAFLPKWQSYQGYIFILLANSQGMDQKHIRQLREDGLELSVC